MITPPTFAGFSTAIWRSLIQSRGGQVRLASRESPMDVTLVVCDNPECSCEEVTLCFRESEAGPRRAALAFDVQVDLLSEREAVPKGLGPEAESTARGVAAGLNGEGRQPLREALRDHRRRIRRIPKTIAEFVAKAEMVPYAHVEAGGNRDDHTYVAYMDMFDADDLEWQVMDSICGAPRCDCTEVRLTFYGADEAPEGRFAALVPLGVGPPRFEDLEGISLTEAKRVFAVWEAETPFDRPALRARYERVRALAKLDAEPARLAARLPGQRTDAPGRAIVAPPRGRREPCPCGSGKRYKNCCGAEDR